MQNYPHGQLAGLCWTKNEKNQENVGKLNKNYTKYQVSQTSQISNKSARARGRINRRINHYLIKLLVKKPNSTRF
jgi:hypothetical protein